LRRLASAAGFELYRKGGLAALRRAAGLK